MSELKKKSSKINPKDTFPHTHYTSKSENFICNLVGRLSACMPIAHIMLIRH